MTPMTVVAFDGKGRSGRNSVAKIVLRQSDGGGGGRRGVLAEEYY